MLKKVVLVLAALVGVLAVVVATRPSTFAVVRTASMNAPGEVVYAWVSDFHKWGEWSPWEELDPGMKKTHSGAERGQGAVYHWVGNDQVGEGRMTITAVKENEMVDINLEFIKPWEATNRTVFTITKEGAGSKLEWKMEGHNNFVAKAASLFMNMDEMIGKDFEKGLKKLSGQVEADAKKRAEALAMKAATATAAAPATP